MLSDYDLHPLNHSEKLYIFCTDHHKNPLSLNPGMFHDSLLEYITEITGNPDTSIFKQIFMPKSDLDEIDDLLKNQ